MELPEAVVLAYTRDVQPGETRKFKSSTHIQQNAIFRFDRISGFYPSGVQCEVANTSSIGLATRVNIGVVFPCRLPLRRATLSLRPAYRGTPLSTSADHSPPNRWIKLLRLGGPGRRQKRAVDSYISDATYVYDTGYVFIGIPYTCTPRNPMRMLGDRL
jgi:hypothetical protein